jgi:hypothetical protein
MVAAAARLLDGGPREELEEGQAALPRELVARGIELKGWGRAGSLSHGDLPVR